ncbi:MAG: site-specific DNA-methyltransferase [Phycisphaerae bacterium]
MQHMDMTIAAPSLPGHISEESGIAPAFSRPSYGIWLYNANCLEVLDAIWRKHPDGCFDMIFADPPYFLSNGGITCQAGKMVSVDKGDWDKSRGVEKNHEFNTEWLVRSQRVLKRDGTIWVTGTQHVIFSVGFAMQQLGFKILNSISWEKPNPPPNLACRYFTHSTETIIWAAKTNTSRHYFNYQAMRKMAGGKQMKTVWRIYPPQSGEKAYGKHPAQKPVELIERCLIAATREGDLVLDPFLGSGTSALACVRQKRRFVGVELDAAWISVAEKRLSEVLDKGLT